jgi:hypothetical protein
MAEQMASDSHMHPQDGHLQYATDSMLHHQMHHHLQQQQTEVGATRYSADETAA